MGCFSPRQRGPEVRPEQKWDYISLKDFKSTSCFTPLAYGYLYFSLLLSMAVYGVDGFTAINLLAFNSWSSQVDPAVKLEYLRWIFSGCIILSIINLGFEHIRARRVMNRGSVAECFLDNLAVRLESVRMGSGQGWRRFLVFAELTKSKKGAEYVALFTYFSFQSWIRVIFCAGPRQAVNAITLYSIYTSKLIVTDTGSVESSLMNFFSKLQKLGSENPQQTVILSGMLFTLIIWVFTFLSLIVAVLFYVFFLWHWIPRQDGGLGGYCSRKINKRLMKIVSVKINKAIEKEERDRLRAELKAAKKTGEKTPIERQATLPTFMESNKDDSLPDMPRLPRSETTATLPVYTSRPASPSAGMPPPPLTRQPTSQGIYSTRAPLVGGAAPMGLERMASPAPTVPTLPQIDMSNYAPARPGTAQSMRNYAQGPMHRSQPSNHSGFQVPFTQSPAPFAGGNNGPMPPPTRSLTGGGMDGYGRPPMPPMPRAVEQLGGRPMFDEPMSMQNGRSSPAPSMYSSRGPPPPMSPGPGYGPSYGPLRSATNPGPPMPQQQRQQGPPQRNMTAPPRQDGYYIQRPGTASSQRTMPNQGYGYGDVEAQRGPSQY